MAQMGLAKGGPRAEFRNYPLLLFEIRKGKDTPSHIRYTTVHSFPLQQERVETILLILWVIIVSDYKTSSFTGIRHAYRRDTDSCSSLTPKQSITAYQ